jgi:hypothetical protein
MSTCTDHVAICRKNTTANIGIGKRLVIRTWAVRKLRTAICYDEMLNLNPRRRNIRRILDALLYRVYLWDGRFFNGKSVLRPQFRPNLLLHSLISTTISWNCPFNPIYNFIVHTKPHNKINMTHFHCQNFRVILYYFFRFSGRVPGEQEFSTRPGDGSTNSYRYWIAFSSMSDPRENKFRIVNVVYSIARIIFITPQSFECCKAGPANSRFVVVVLLFGWCTYKTSKDKTSKDKTSKDKTSKDKTSTHQNVDTSKRRQLQNVEFLSISSYIQEWVFVHRP